MMNGENKNVLFKARFQNGGVELCPTCPNCGSEHAVRIGDTALPDYSDEQASGVYRCGHCRNEYEFIKPLETRAYSPSAQCPVCDSYHTKCVKTGRVNRYHICLNAKCCKPFKTVRPANERLERLNERN